MRLSLLILTFVLSVQLSAQLRFTYVSPSDQQLTIKNFGASSLEISNYQFCSLFNYSSLSSAAVTVVDGDFNLAPNESVTVNWNAPSGGFNETMSDIGLYSSSNFTNAASMAAFMEYGAGLQGRENVAVSAGLWQTNTFVSGAGPYYYIGSGTESGFSFWSTEPLVEVTPVVINEIDSDTEGTDQLEFIELFGNAGASLDGLVLVLFNGSASNGSYQAYDLDGYQLSSTGFFVIGSAAVPNVNYVIPNNTIQNGADGIAVYIGDASDWTAGTPPSANNLMDAVVYNTGPAADQDLIDALTPGLSQLTETPASQNALYSLSRVPDGGSPLNNQFYIGQVPTPGITNVIAPACNGGVVALLSGSGTPLCSDQDNAPLTFSYSDEFIIDGYSWLVTDSDGIIVAATNSATIDFDGLGIGPFYVLGLSYTGTVDTSVGEQSADLTGNGCISLSANSIEIPFAPCIITECDGGAISSSNGDSYLTLCKDGMPDVFSFSQSSSSAGNYAFVITNTDNSIVQVITGNNADFDILPEGSYRVWGLSYLGNLINSTIEPGDAVNGVMSDGACVQLSSGFVLVVSTNCIAGPGCEELYISEYIEGVNFNKAIEIFNPGNFPIDLSEYDIIGYYNGSTTPGFVHPLSGVLGAGETYVVANPGSDPGLLAAADVTNNTMLFNGNDAVILRKGNTTIDVVGVVGQDPGNNVGWIFNGLSTYNRVLIRKPSVNAPTSNWIYSTGQWNGYELTDFSHLGNHFALPCSNDPFIGFQLPAVSVSEGIGHVTVAVQAFNIPTQVEVTVDIVGGTASAGSDYANVFPVLLSFQPGTSSQTLQLPIIDDESEEQTEFIQLGLSSAQTVVWVTQQTVVSIEANDPVYDLYPIAQITTINAQGVLDSLETFCELRGIVHGINFNSSGLHFHLIDPTDGIKIFRTNGNLGYFPVEGDSIHVRGKTQQFMGQAELTPDAIELISQGHTLETPVITGELSEEMESHLVTIECVALVDVLQWTSQGSGFMVTMTDGSNDFTVRIEGETSLFNETAIQGHFNLTGIVEQLDATEPYDSDYYLLPRYVEDVSHQVIASFASFSGIQFGDNGATVQFENTSSGATSYTWEFGDGETSSEVSPVYVYPSEWLADNPEFTIGLIAISEIGCADTLEIDVIAIYTSVEEFPKTEFSVWPNPVENRLQVTCSAPIIRYVVTDVSGRYLAGAAGLSDENLIIHTESWPSGLYHLSIFSENGIVSHAKVLRQ